MGKVRTKDEDGISPIERRFGDEYMIDLDASKAATRAGLRPSRGWKMLQRQPVQEYIRKRMEERSQRVEITQDDVVRELRNLARKGGTPESVQRQCWTDIGKHLGMFSKHRPVAIAAAPVNPDVAQLKDDEVDNEYDRLIRELGQGGEAEASSGTEARKGKARAGRPVRNLRPN